MTAAISTQTEPTWSTRCVVTGDLEYLETEITKIVNNNFLIPVYVTVMFLSAFIVPRFAVRESDWNIVQPSGII